MKNMTVVILAVALIATGCAPTYNDVGVGQDLYSARTPQDTNNLSAYFRQLCAQSRLVASDALGSCSDYTELVQTGFNDIDQRCDRYLAWIDFKRTEALRVKSGIASLGFATATVLTIANAGVDSIGYVAAALGLAVSLYDGYNNSLLVGLESTTIKQIVYKRRLEYRRQFSKLNYKHTPEMVYALRGYLRICTPQTIVLDTNTYALSAAAGLRVPALDETIKQEVDASGIASGRRAVSPYTPGNQSISRQKVKCPECQGLFPDNAGFTVADIKAVQEGLCVKADGATGESTLAGVKNYRQTQGKDRSGSLSETEYDEITTYGCRVGDTARGISSFFEATTYRGNALKLQQLVSNLNTVQPVPLLDPQTTTLTSDVLRAKIRATRAAYKLETGDAVQDSFMSRDLARRLAQAAASSKNASGEVGQ